MYKLSYAAIKFISSDSISFAVFIDFVLFLEDGKSTGLCLSPYYKKNGN